MNIQRLLRISEEIEQVVSQIYRHWQHVFENESSLSALWRKMADDELDHVQQVQLARRVYNEKIFEASNVSLESLEKALARARQLLEDVKQKEISPETALRAAIRIEEEFSKAHLLNSTSINDQSMKAMFKSLARADELHVATLRDFANAFLEKK